MNRTLIKDLSPPECPTAIRVCGWVERVKVTKWMIFVVIYDESGKLQVSIQRSAEGALSALEERAAALSRESAIEIMGLLNANPQVKMGGMELTPQEILVHNISEEPPIARQNFGEDARQNWRFLDLRWNEEGRETFRVQTAVLAAMHEWWQREGWFVMQSPKIMGAASESNGAELFTLDFFGEPATLAQSAQLYKQIAMASGITKYAEVGPTFRSDPSQTTRHAAEFTTIDMELAWINDHHDIMRVEYALLAHVFDRVRDTCPDTAMKKSLATLDPKVVPMITMNDALKVLADMHITIPPERYGDLTPEAERALGVWGGKEFGVPLLFVTDYPAVARPFYHMRHPGDSSLTRSFDLLYKGVEITTGAQREHRFDTLVRQAEEKGVGLKDIEFYTSIFRYGCPPHGGFGLGLARLLCMMMNLPNVREAAFIHRAKGRLIP